MLDITMKRMRMIMVQSLAPGVTGRIVPFV